MFYDNWWVLCRHILRVMVGLGIWGNPKFLSIPHAYIKKRWSRDCKKQPLSTGSSSSRLSPNNDYVGRYQQLCSVMVAAGPRICHSKAAYDIFISKVVDAINAAELKLDEDQTLSQTPVITSEPVAGSPDFSKLTMKKRPKSISNRKRLKANNEIRQQKKKQANKAELKRQQEAGEGNSDGD